MQKPKTTTATKSQTSYEIMMSIGDRLTEDLNRFGELEQIILDHPEWVAADPRLKAIVAASNNPKLRSLA